MGSTKRDKMKRSMAQAHHDFDRGLGHLQDVHAEFSGVHDDYADVLEIMAQHVIQVQEWILGFWAKAWGKPPGDINSYRG